MKDVFIHSEFIKADSFLKLCGEVGSGGQAKMLIADGLVKVNGELCLMRGKKLFDGDTVDIYGAQYRVRRINEDNESPV